MRVPVIPYRETAEFEQQEVDPFVAGVMAVFVLIGVLVWMLAIAKLVDLYG